MIFIDGTLKYYSNYWMLVAHAVVHGSQKTWYRSTTTSVAMTNIVEDTRGKICSMPIQPKLLNLLNVAADDTGIDKVRITLGGQPLARNGLEVSLARHNHGWVVNIQLIRTLVWPSGWSVATLQCRTV